MPNRISRELPADEGAYVRGLCEEVLERSAKRLAVNVHPKYAQVLIGLSTGDLHGGMLKLKMPFHEESPDSDSQDSAPEAFKNLVAFRICRTNQSFKKLNWEVVVPDDIEAPVSIEYEKDVRYQPVHEDMMRQFADVDYTSVERRAS